MENNNGTINNRAALRALTQEYAQLQDEMLEGFLVKLVDDNFFRWEVGIFGPPDTLYEGGYFRAELCFPADYPFSPPTMVFLTKIWHPNIYKTGKVCISILQSATNSIGEDYAERWNPTQNVRTILLSVISLLNEPNIMSPANGIAAFWYRRHCETMGSESRYRETVHKQVSDSKQYALQMGIKVPTTREEYCVRYRPESSAKPEPIFEDGAFLFFGNESEEEEEEEEEEEQKQEDEKQEDKELEDGELEDGELQDEEEEEEKEKVKGRKDQKECDQEPKKRKTQDEGQAAGEQKKQASGQNKDLPPYDLGQAQH